MNRRLVRTGKTLLWGLVVVTIVLITQNFDVNSEYVLWGLIVVMYLVFENRFEQMSNDLRMVEMFLEERYPDEFGGDEFRRKF